MGIGLVTFLKNRNLSDEWLQLIDELQLIDDGVGYALKGEMGKLHDEWLMVDENLELWTAEGKGFPMWRKRVLITHLAAQAWENVCKRFDFEKASTRLGMRMTIDGSGDQFIKMQGLSSYEFCDEDGGAVGMESDEEGVDPQEEMEQSAVVSDALVDSSDEEADGVVGGPSGVASGVAGARATRVRTMTTMSTKTASTRPTRTTTPLAAWPTTSATRKHQRAGR